MKAIDRGSRRTIAWILGNRDRATFRRLYDKVKHLKNCTFYTDKWDAFMKVLPPERHVIGKSGTFTIEQDNSNTRHHLGRFHATNQGRLKEQGNGGFDHPLVVFAHQTGSFCGLARKVCISLYVTLSNFPHSTGSAVLSTTRRSTKLVCTPDTPAMRVMRCSSNSW
ncbi:MAG: hypothetical protein LBE06_08210 [Azoarcus sp.]|nr:hypothetical protein [Azoarcus sp.]